MAAMTAPVKRVLADVAETADATEVATYIRSIARELRDIAAGHDLEFLAYVLTMAVDEAGSIASNGRRGTPTDAA